jgi:hypothetical protein
MKPYRKMTFGAVDQFGDEETFVIFVEVGSAIEDLTYNLMSLLENHSIELHERLHVIQSLIALSEVSKELHEYKQLSSIGKRVD